MDCNIFIIEFYIKKEIRKPLPLMNEGLGELRVSQTLFLLVLLSAQIFPEECDNNFLVCSDQRPEGKSLHDMENQQIQRSDLFSSDSGVSDQYFRRISILFGASAPKFSVRTRSAPESDEERFSRVGSKNDVFEYDRGIFFDEVNDF